MISALVQLLISSLVCVGLLSAWAATSTRHWFVRTGVFVGVLALLLLIPAYEPLVVFVLQGAVVAVGVQTARWWRRRKEDVGEVPRRARFSLATLLLVTVYVAIAAAVIARLPEQGFYAWLNIMLVGIVAGLATLLSLWILVRWWIRVTAGLVLALLISLLLFWDDWLLSGFGFYDEPAAFWILIICVAGCSSVLLWLIGGVAHGNPVRSGSRWKRVIANATLLLSTIVIVVPSASVYYQLMTPLPIPQTVLPDPNGWDDLVAAGKTLKSLKELRTINFDDTATQAQLSTTVKALEPVFERLLIGLEKQVSCPVGYNIYDIDMDVMQAMRALARALFARGRLAKLEGRFDEAADGSLDGIRFGYAIRRDGLLIDMLVGSACSGVGRHALYGVRKELTVPHCKSLVAQLSRLERHADPVEDFVFRDRVWSQHAFGWQGHLWLILEYDDLWDAEYSYVTAFNRERAEMRLLRLELAIQVWQKTHGGLPESLNKLVPEIIDAVPVDPFDSEGRLMQYRRTEENTDVGYILYSVGPKF